MLTPMVPVAYLRTVHQFLLQHHQIHTIRDRYRDQDNQSLLSNRPHSKSTLAMDHMMAIWTDRCAVQIQVSIFVEFFFLLHFENTTFTESILNIWFIHLLPDCFPNCEIPPPPPPPPQNFQPNMLPPQLNEAFKLARQMVTDGTKMLSLLQDMSAGLSIPYLNNNNNNPGMPPVKQNFPVFTPETNYYNN